MDFGISKFAGEHTRMASPTGSTILGTPAYMAPEQFDGGGHIDARTDVHALGLVLYECLSGRPAYQADQLMVLLRKISFGERLPLGELRPELPTTVLQLVDKALCTDKNLRFASARALAEALRHEEEYLARTSGLLSAVAGSARAPQQSPERPSTIVLDPDLQRRAEGHSIIPGSTTMGLASGSAEPPAQSRSLTVIGLGAAALVLGLVLAIPLAQLGRTGATKPSATSVAESTPARPETLTNTPTEQPSVRVADSTSTIAVGVSSAISSSASQTSATASPASRRPQGSAKTSNLATPSEYP